MSEAHAAWWAGIPCALDPRSSPRYQRLRGTDPSIATVAFPLNLFRSLVPTQPAPGQRFLYRPSGEPDVARIHETAPIGYVQLERPPFVGDLVFAQGVQGFEQKVTAHGLYLLDTRIVDPVNRSAEDGDKTTPIVEFQLGDVRFAWPDHGSITAEWNVRVQTGRVVHVIGGTNLSGPLSAPSIAKLREDQVFQQRGAKEGGKEPTPLREIVQALLNALPGQLQIERWPDEFLRDKPPPEVRCVSARPKAVLDGILAEYRLELDVEGANGPAAALYGEGEGVVGERDGGTHDPEAREGIWAASLVADGDRYVRRPNRPVREVEVLGDETVYDAQVDRCTPVMFYTVERPDQPQRLVVVELTPRNLNAVALGQRMPEFLALNAPDTPLLSQLPDAADRQLILATLGVDAPRLPVALSVAPVPQDPKTGVGLADPYVWQRLPLVEEDVWVQTIPWLDDSTRHLLMDQIWRVYQLPRQLWRLLPLLDRAATDASGKRLELVVEAFGFRKCVTRVDVTKKAKAAAQDEAAKARQVVVDRLTEVNGELERAKKTRAALADPTPAEVLEAIKQGWDAGHSLWPGEARADLRRRSDRTFEKYFEGVARLGRSWLRQIDPDAFKGELDSEEVAARIARIDERIKQLEADREALTASLNPVRTKEQEVAAFEAELSRQRASGGGVPASERRKLEKLYEDLAKLREEETKQGTREESTKWEDRTYFQNMQRRKVPFRVIDAKLGLIEILGDLPVWLANPNVTDLSQTIVLPMPVRVTFGTKNADPIVLETGDPPRNFYVQNTVNAIKGLPGVAEFVGTFDDTLPADVGAKSLRFTFTPEDLGSEAEVSPEAYTVVVDARPPLRLLVELGGHNNRAGQIARVLPLVRSLFARPETLDGGSLTIKGPRNVPLTGRVSAVEIRPAGPGEGFVTEVSFDANAAPLPGVEGPIDLEEGPVRLQFGIDTKATENL